MKTIGLNDIQLDACPEADAVKAAEEFRDFAPLNFKDRISLDYLTREGFVTAEQVTFNGEPAYVVWWSKTLDNGLSINACQSLRDGVSVDVAFIAAERIQTREGCPYLRFASIRQGLLRHAERRGYKFETVVMTKG